MVDISNKIIAVNKYQDYHNYLHKIAVTKHITDYQFNGETNDNPLENSKCLYDYIA